MATNTVPCNESPIAGDVAYEHAVEFLFQAYQQGGDIPPDANPATTFDFSTLFLGGFVGVGGLGGAIAF